VGALCGVGFGRQWRLGPADCPEIGEIMAIVYLTTQSKKPIKPGTGRHPSTSTRAQTAKAISGNEEIIPISPSMLAAGEAVLDAACEAGEIWPPSYSVLSAAADVYIAMERARLVPAIAGSPPPKGAVSRKS